MEWYPAIVVHGFRNGRKFGFPTANLSGDAMRKVAPGVYAAIVNVDGKCYKGMLYVGTRPTLDLRGTTFEIHILNFNDNIYGKNLAFAIVARLRDEQRFNSVRELIDQLHVDRSEVDKFVDLDRFDSFGYINLDNEKD